MTWSDRWSPRGPQPAPAAELPRASDSRRPDPGRWWTRGWNPVIGCRKVSPGCQHCWAVGLAEKLGWKPDWSGLVGGDGDWTGKIAVRYEEFARARKWAGQTVFAGQMTDLAACPPGTVRLIWDLMAKTPSRYIVLTKRPELLSGWPSLPNLWVGVSVESRDYLHRVFELARRWSGKRLVSFEPLLGPVGLEGTLPVDWVIAGPENHAGARPCEPSWIDAIGRWSRTRGVPFFDKRPGARVREYPWAVAPQPEQLGLEGLR